MGPSVRWDDGMVDRYFHFFRLAGWPCGGGGGPWSCASSTRLQVRSSSRRTPGSILILLLPWISGQEASEIKMGPSVRWDDGVVDLYFRFFRFFRLAGWPRGGGRHWPCVPSTRRSVRHPGARRDPS